MKFKQVVLYSRRPKLLSLFICEMFETSMKHAGEREEVIKHQSIMVNFEVRERLKKEEGQASCDLLPNQLLEFTVDTSSELENIKQKIQFFSYRHELVLTDLIAEEKGAFLIVRDPDERFWKFSVGS